MDRHDKHLTHYWVGHKDGYLFCACGIAKVYGVMLPLDILREVMI
jgi:hypothetical protein